MDAPVRLTDRINCYFLSRLHHVHTRHCHCPSVLPRYMFSHVGEKHHLTITVSLIGGISEGNGGGYSIACSPVFVYRSPSLFIPFALIYSSQLAADEDTCRDVFVIDRSSLPPRTVLDRDTLQLLERLSLVDFNTEVRLRLVPAPLPHVPDECCIGNGVANFLIAGALLSAQIHSP